MLFFRRENRFVLDSSSIIDGRVVYLFEKKIFEGKIIIPTLVRTIVRKSTGNKGERAIKILKRHATVEFIHERGNGLVEEICVLKVARRRDAKVFTVSDEVCRQAKLYPRINIIDIRDLYRLLTPIFTPNKLISVKILKRGLSHSEGVGYIEGVKVVVEDAAKFINQTVTARVTTMLSFETGNLVFCTMHETRDEEKSTTLQEKHKDR